MFTGDRLVCIQQFEGMVSVKVMVFNASLKQYFSYIVMVSFIGGGNRSTHRKPLTCCKSLTNFIYHIKLYQVHLGMSGTRTHNRSGDSHYHTITIRTTKKYIQHIPYFSSDSNKRHTHLTKYKNIEFSNTSVMSVLECNPIPKYEI